MEIDLNVVNSADEHLDDGFVKGYSNNLPFISSSMIFQNFVSLLKQFSEDPKYKQLIPNLASTDKSVCNDDSIGFVHLKRKNRVCIVKAKLFDKNTSGNNVFDVMVIVDEEDGKLTSECSECPEKGGACKHCISFLLWLNRKSETSSQDIVCYYGDFLDANLKTNKNNIASNVNKIKVKNFVKDVVRVLQNENIDCPLRWNYLTGLSPEKRYGGLSIHEMIMNAVAKKMTINMFYEHAKRMIVSDFSRQILADKTKYNTKYNDWNLELRYGRISSAKVSDCVNANVSQSLLYESILGCDKFVDPVLQKKKLAVRKRLEKYTKTTYDNCRINLNPNYPVIFDVPDGICQSHVVEIKCPKSKDHMNKYVTESGSISEKYFMEIQVHMFLQNKTAGVVCVADPEFETNQEIYMHSFNLNRNFASNSLNKAMNYWRNLVYPELFAAWAEK